MDARRAVSLAIASGQWEQYLPGRGKRYAAAVPVEQACTEDAFQGLDLL